MLARLRERSGNSRNIHIVEAPHHATSIATGSCDRVFMANLWTELPDPIAALREAARLLREDGRLILIEWHAVANSPEAPGSRVGFHETFFAVKTLMARSLNGEPYQNCIRMPAQRYSLQTRASHGRVLPGSSGSSHACVYLSPKRILASYSSGFFALSTRSAYTRSTAFFIITFISSSVILEKPARPAQ